jgi:prevent-host-death family protein
MNGMASTILAKNMATTLDRVENGEEIVVLRRSTPVGVLVPVDVYQRMLEACDTVENQITAVRAECEADYIGLRMRLAELEYRVGIEG